MLSFSVIVIWDLHLCVLYFAACQSLNSYTFSCSRKILGLVLCLSTGNCSNMVYVLRNHF